MVHSFLERQKPLSAKPNLAINNISYFISRIPTSKAHFAHERAIGVIKCEERDRMVWIILGLMRNQDLMVCFSLFSLYINISIYVKHQRRLFLCGWFVHHRWQEQNTQKKSVYSKEGMAQSGSFGLTHPFSSYLAAIHKFRNWRLNHTYIHTHKNLSHYPCRDLSLSYILMQLFNAVFTLQQNLSLLITKTLIFSIFLIKAQNKA